MNSISITKLYDQVAVKMGKDAAENLTGFIEQKIKAEVESRSTILATKEDLVKVVLATKDDLAEFKIATKKEIADLKLATEAQFAEVKLSTETQFAELKLSTKAEFAVVKKEIAETKADMVKWMFIFWIGQAVTIFGLIVLFIKK